LLPLGEDLFALEMGSQTHRPPEPGPPSPPPPLAAWGWPSKSWPSAWGATVVRRQGREPLGPW